MLQLAKMLHLALLACVFRGHGALEARELARTQIFKAAKFCPAVSVAPAADSENCIPWSIDPTNTKRGWYWDAGMCGLALTSNDTLISFHEGEKFGLCGVEFTAQPPDWCQRYPSLFVGPLDRPPGR